jgi:hypothetical protein
MILIRNTFTAKPGNAGKLAAHLKEMATLGQLRNPRVLTDFVADFNTVVLEHEVDSLADFETLIARYGSDPQMREKAGAYFDLWRTGKRELFRIV